jgi:hypothetical protein
LPPRINLPAAFFYSKVAMTLLEFRDLIVRASKAYSDSLQRDAVLLTLLSAQLADAERARQILRAKGYGGFGMTATETAALVPAAEAAHQRYEQIGPRA